MKKCQSFSTRRILRFDILEDRTLMSGNVLATLNANTGVLDAADTTQAVAPPKAGIASSGVAAVVILFISFILCSILGGFVGACLAKLTSPGLGDEIKQPIWGVWGAILGAVAGLVLGTVIVVRANNTK
jgi:hypothetical protein